MAEVATQNVTAGIAPELRPFFIGTPTTPGVIPRAERESLRGYADVYQPLAQAGLTGAGRVAPITGTMLETAQRGLGALGPATGFGQGAQQFDMASQVFQNLSGVQAPTVQAGPLTQFQMGAPTDVASRGVTSRDITGAQTAFNPQLQQYQLQGPQAFTGDVVSQYTSPYISGVVEAQERAAVDAAKRAQLEQNLASARQGTYGGARQALLQAERESGLRTQLGDIRARGLQDAYSQAQAQFERDRAAQMQAGQANLQAALQTQQLGTQTGLQTALANLNNEQQARVQSEANRLQASGMTQDAALRAALANQQAGLTVGQQNLAAALGVQQLGSQQNLAAQQANQAASLQAAQQRQAAAQGLAGLGSAYGGLGTQQQAAELQRLQAQTGFGQLQQQIGQQGLTAAYEDAMRQAQFPQQQLSFYSNILRGTPTSTSQVTQQTPSPSFLENLTSAGLGALGLYKLYNAF